MEERKRQGAYSMVEMMVVLAILLVVSRAFYKYIIPNVTLFQRNLVRHEIDGQARQCMELIPRLLSNAKATSVRVRTPLGGPPYSFIQFYTIDNSSYTITWSSAPPNSVHVIHQPDSAITATDSVIASNVTSLIFSLDSRDPALVYFYLQLDAPLDSTGNPEHTYTIVEPRKTIRMITTQ